MMATAQIIANSIQFMALAIAMGVQVGLLVYTHFRLKHLERLISECEA